MQDQLTQEVLVRLDALAAKLGVTAERLWDVLVASAALRWYSVAEAGVLFAVSALIAVWGWRNANRRGWFIATGGTKYDETLWGLIPIAAVVSTGVCFVVTVVQIVSALKATAMPEYHALQQVLKLLGK